MAIDDLTRDRLLHVAELLDGAVPVISQPEQGFPGSQDLALGLDELDLVPVVHLLHNGGGLYESSLCTDLQVRSGHLTAYKRVKNIIAAVTNNLKISQNNLNYLRLKNRNS